MRGCPVCAMGNPSVFTLPDIPTAENRLRPVTVTAALGFRVDRVLNLSVGPNKAFSRCMVVSARRRRCPPASAFHALEPISAIRLTITPRVGGGALAAGRGRDCCPFAWRDDGVGARREDRLVTARAVIGLVGRDLFWRCFDTGQKSGRYQSVGHGSWSQFAGQGHVFVLPECP